MKLKYLLAIFFTLSLFTFSCTPYKGVPYFQDLKRDSIQAEKIMNYTPLTIQPGDLLALNVNSLNHEADQQFNYNLERPSGINSVTGLTDNGTSSEGTVFGYLVDEEGNINLPIIGEVKVSGLSTKQVSVDLQTRLATVLSNPIVNVRLVNFSVSILGDVKTPGVFTIANEKTTVTEAIALAGDLNTTGIRNILLIREVDGIRKYIPIDLKSKNFMNSPYYYLENKDVIYVQPNKDKVSGSDSAFTKASLLLGALSLLAIFLTRK